VLLAQIKNQRNQSKLRDSIFVKTPIPEKRPKTKMEQLYPPRQRFMTLSDMEHEAASPRLHSSHRSSIISAFDHQRSCISSIHQCWTKSLSLVL